MSRGIDMERPTLRQRLKETFLGERPRDRRNSLLILFWSAIWAVTITSTERAIMTGQAEGELAWGLVALTAVITVVALAAYVRFIREADEMIRRAHVNALAFGFAAGVVFSAANGIGFSMGRPAYGTNDMLAVMCFAYAGKVLWNLWRNR